MWGLAQASWPPGTTQLTEAQIPWLCMQHPPQQPSHAILARHRKLGRHWLASHQAAACSSGAATGARRAGSTSQHRSVLLVCLPGCLGLSWTSAAPWLLRDRSTRCASAARQTMSRATLAGTTASQRSWSPFKFWCDCRPRASSTLAAEVAGPAAQATERYPVVDIREQCEELRARVCKETLAGGLIYVSGGDLQHRNGADVYYKFRPASNFAYLTGVTEPGFACLLDPETQRFTLVAPKVPEDAAVWWGGLPSLDQLAEQAGADACIYAEDLPSYVRQHHADVQTLHILPGDDPQQQAQLLALPHFAQHQQQAVQQLAGLQALQAVHSGSTSSAHSSSAGPAQLNLAFLESTLHRCRATKTAAEVGCLLEASRGSAAAHKAMWAACKPGVKEFQLEAAFSHAAGQAGLMQLGYPCIVGAGRNAAVLHYERNSATVGLGDLVLVDAGAEFRHYTADITRTFPASGKFTAQQRDVYNLVLSLQQHALSKIKPGVAWADVQQSTRRLLLEQLLQLGLVQGSLDALTEAGVDRVFMPHGLGHFLGLDVHDVSDVGPVPERLQAGQVITVEPGVYFMPLLLQRAFSDPKQASLLVRSAVEPLVDLGGVRIEDNILVTDDGHFNLTMAAGMPKEAVEIEAYMAEHNVHLNN